jgi:hypothetical protein
LWLQIRSEPRAHPVYLFAVKARDATDTSQNCPWNDSIASKYNKRGYAGAGAFGANGDRDLMSAESKEAEYRRHAGSLMVLASRAATIADKFRLLVMAHDWLQLADKIARLRRRRRESAAEHRDPIVCDHTHASEARMSTNLRD